MIWESFYSCLTEFVLASLLISHLSFVFPQIKIIYLISCFWKILTLFSSQYVKYFVSSSASWAKVAFASEIFV